MQNSVVGNDYDDDEKEEEEDVVIMSDLLSNIPFQTMTPSHAATESASIGDFFDNLLGEPDTVPDLPSVSQALPVSSLHGAELDDGMFTEPPASSHQQQDSNDGYDVSSDSESAVPGYESIANKQTTKKNTTARAQSRRQLPGQLLQRSTVPESDHDEEVGRPESSPSNSRPRRQVPGQITYNNVPERTEEEPELLTTRSGKSASQSLGQLQILATDNDDATAETTGLASPTRARPRRQLPGTDNASREPGNPPATPTGTRRTIPQRRTMVRQQNESIVNGSSSIVTESASRRRQTTTSTTTRSATQNTGTRRRINNNDEFPGLPDTEQNYNQEVPLVPGKKYTAILTARIICSTPSNDIRSRAQEDQDGDRVNFKRFKKVVITI